MVVRARARAARRRGRPLVVEIDRLAAAHGCGGTAEIYSRGKGRRLAGRTRGATHRIDDEHPIGGTAAGHESLRRRRIRADA